MSGSNDEASNGLSAEERVALLDAMFAVLEALTAAQKSSHATRKALVQLLHDHPETAVRTLQSALSSEMEHDTMGETLESYRKLLSVFSGKHDG